MGKGFWRELLKGCLVCRRHFEMRKFETMRIRLGQLGSGCGLPLAHYRESQGRHHFTSTEGL